MLGNGKEKILRAFREEMRMKKCDEIDSTTPAGRSKKKVNSSTETQGGNPQPPMRGHRVKTDLAWAMSTKLIGRVVKYTNGEEPGSPVSGSTTEGKPEDADQYIALEKKEGRVDSSFRPHKEKKTERKGGSALCHRTAALKHHHQTEGRN